MISLAIDILVSLLLVVTIGYSAVLNKRLKRLRDEEDVMRVTVQELVNSSSLADKALKDLKAMAENSDAALRARLSEAETTASILSQATQQGQSMLARLGQAGVEVSDIIVEPAPQIANAPSPAFASLRASAQRLSARAPL